MLRKFDNTHVGDGRDAWAMADFKMRTGLRLERLRRKHGLSQENLAASLGVDPVTISRWETGQSYPQTRQRNRIRSHFGLSQEEFEELFVERSSLLERGTGIYSFTRFTKLAEAGTPTSEIIDRVGAIYDEFPAPDHEGNAYGDPAVWDALIGDNLAFGTRFARGGEWIGYWLCLPVTEEFYRRGIAGKNVNREISPADIDLMFVPTGLRLYFVDLFILRRHLNEGSAPLLLRSFADFFKSWAESGYFFEKGFANLSSDEAIVYCSKIGFRKVVEHECHVYLKNGDPVPTQIYEVDFTDPNTPLFSFCDDVRALYARHFKW